MHKSPLVDNQIVYQGYVRLAKGHALDIDPTVERADAVGYATTSSAGAREASPGCRHLDWVASGCRL